MHRFTWALSGCLVSCGPTVSTQSGTDADSDSSSSSGSTQNPTDPTVSPTTTGTSTTADDSSTTERPEPTGSSSDGDSSTGTPPPKCGSDGCAVDVVVVVDNSANMGLPQRALARNMVQLERELSQLSADVQVMVTSTDFGNPACTPFKPDGYQPARGAPMSTPCVDRLDAFTGLGTNPPQVPEICTDVCPEPVAPLRDPFVAFGPGGTNLPELIGPADVDGDGTNDPPAARALACLTPLGINGCGYESPLETMLQALNPDASWNQGSRPFLRDDAILAVVLLTDEVDCSVSNFDMMTNPVFQEIRPENGMPAASSAICWNAGTTCEGPDASGLFAECTSFGDQLQPVERYTDFFEYLRNAEDKEVVMLSLVGVPPVTDHADDVPYTPTMGGVEDLVYRTWREGEHPAGDLLPADVAAGETAADKAFDFGIGPGCTEVTVEGGVQGLPPVRIREVCEGLDGSDDLADRRCCLESVCGDDYSAAIRCLGGLVRNASQ